MCERIGLCDAASTTHACAASSTATAPPCAPCARGPPRSCRASGSRRPTFATPASLIAARAPCEVATVTALSPRRDVVVFVFGGGSWAACSYGHGCRDRQHTETCDETLLGDRARWNSLKLRPTRDLLHVAHDAVWSSLWPLPEVGKPRAKTTKGPPKGPLAPITQPALCLEYHVVDATDGVEHAQLHLCQVVPVHIYRGDAAI